MKYALASLFAVIGLYLVGVCFGAISKGQLIAKSPDYPILMADRPILFWLVIGTIALVAGKCLQVAWSICRSPAEPPEN